MAELNPFVLESFQDDFLREALGTRNLDDYLIHSSAFANLIGPERTKREKGDLTGLFGEKVTPEETFHADGRPRSSEPNYRINVVGYLPIIGIDPSKVLFFRRTTLSQIPKPEYFWTSDYSETVNGLNQEIRDKSKTVILVAPLDIVSNPGLMQDINDDGGLAVRQIRAGVFNQNDAIAIISNLNGDKGYGK